MMRPPLVARVRFEGHRLGLWIPLFLVWLLLAALLLPFLVVFVVVALFAPPRWRLWPLAGGAWRVFCETRGTRIELVERGRGVSIALI